MCFKRFALEWSFGRVVIGEGFSLRIGWLGHLITRCGLRLIPSRALRVGGSALVCNLGLEAVLVVGHVSDCLDPSVGERHLVGSLNGITV